MPLFPLFASKPKAGTMADRFKVYIDTSFKAALKFQDLDINATAHEILERLKQQDYDSIKILILVAVHPKAK